MVYLFIKKRRHQNTTDSPSQAYPDQSYQYRLSSSPHMVRSVPRITESLGWQATVMHGDEESDGIPLTGIRKKVEMGVQEE